MKTTCSRTMASKTFWRICNADYTLIEQSYFILSTQSEGIKYNLLITASTVNTGDSAK